MRLTATTFNKGLVRTSLLLAIAALAPACSGGSPGAPPPPPTISGTAAKGLPIAAAPVTLKGANGMSVPSTTATDGTYSVVVTGLTSPYMLQVNLGAGAFLYSVGTSVGTVNVTPFTDLIVREYYQVQGLNVDVEFATPTVAPPSASEILIIQSIIFPIVSGWFPQAGLDPNSFDLITTPFLANGSGFDGILDLTTTSVPGANMIQVVINNGTTTQTSTVTSSTSASSLTEVTAVVAASGTSNSTSSTVVPTPSTSALQTAVNEVNAFLAQFWNMVISKGALLADSDFIPSGAVTLLDDGNNRTVWAGLKASHLRGQTFGGGTTSISQVIAFDNTTNPASPVLTAISDGGQATQYVKIGANWFFNGNQQLGNVQTQVANTESQAFSGGATVTQKINCAVVAPQGTISTVTLQIDPAVQTTPASTTWANSASNPAPAAISVPNSGSTTIVSYQPTPGGATQNLLQDSFLYYPSLATPPPPGTLVSFLVTPVSGSPQTYLVGTLATTTSTFTLTNPTNYLLSSANLGSTLTVTWALPAGFLIADQQCECFLKAGSFQQIFPSGNLTPTSTSGTFNLPTTINGGGGPLSVTSVVLVVAILGPNGEDIHLNHVLDQ